MKLRMKFVCWLTGAFLVTMFCRSPSGHQTAEAEVMESRSAIEVSSDPKDIEEARRLGRTSRAEELAAILRNLKGIWLFDRDSIELLRQERDRSIQSLKPVLRSPVPEARVAAAALLVKLGDDAGRTVIVQLLDDGAARQSLLSRLGNLKEEEVGQWPEVQKWVLARLDDPDQQTRREAVSVAMQLNISAAGPKLTELATQPGGDPNGWIALCAARLGPSMASLDTVAKRLESEKNRDARRWLVGALEYLILASDPAVSQRAVDVTGRILNRSAAAEYDGVDIPMALAARGGSAAADVLRVLYESGGSWSVRGESLKALAKVDPEEATALAVKALAEPASLQYAAEAIGEAARGSRNPEIIRALADASSRQEDDSALLEFIVDAMLSVGGDEAKSAAEKLLPRKDSWARMIVKWKLAGMTPEKAAERLVGLGLIDPPAAEKGLADLRARSEEFETEPGLIELLDAAGALISFDVETGEMPVRHDLLILDFAASSAGVFAPQAVVETWNRKHARDDKADYTIQFVHDGRRYRFKATDFGDWYDVGAVVTAIHKALADAGITKRFHTIDSDGQLAFFVFGDVGVVAEVAREFGLPLSADVGRAEREGKGFERQAIKDLKPDGSR